MPPQPIEIVPLRTREQVQSEIEWAYSESKARFHRAKGGPAERAAFTDAMKALAQAVDAVGLRKGVTVNVDVGVMQKLDSVYDGMTVEQIRASVLAKLAIIAGSS